MRSYGYFDELSGFLEKPENEDLVQVPHDDEAGDLEDFDEGDSDEAEALENGKIFIF